MSCGKSLCQAMLTYVYTRDTAQTGWWDVVEGSFRDILTGWNSGGGGVLNTSIATVKIDLS